MEFKKNVLLIIENFRSDQNYTPGCAEVSKIFYFKNEEEILIFPFSCFEIKKIEKKEDYYIIYLDYLGKYEKLFEGRDPVKLIEKIPHYSDLSLEVFQSDLIEEEYKKIFNENNDSEEGEVAVAFLWVYQIILKKKAMILIKC